MKQLAKRWGRWRLTTGLNVESTVPGTKAGESFNAFLDSTRIPITGTVDIDREVIERFLAYLNTYSPGVITKRARMGQFNTCLLTVRRHGFVTDLPTQPRSTGTNLNRPSQTHTHLKPRGESPLPAQQTPNVCGTGHINRAPTAAHYATQTSLSPLVDTGGGYVIPEQ